MSEPVYIVKLCGICRQDYMERTKERFEQELQGRVIVVDKRVEDIVQVKPQDADGLVKLLAGDDWKEME